MACMRVAVSELLLSVKDAGVMMSLAENDILVDGCGDAVCCNWLKRNGKLRGDEDEKPVEKVGGAEDLAPPSCGEEEEAVE